MSKGGRPTKYNKEYNNQVVKLCRLGATDKQIADFFGVTEQTVNNWKTREPEFFESLKIGKLESDMEVANSLYKKATGYKYMIQKEVKLKCYDDQGRQVERFEIVDLIQEQPPDTTAMIFWLKNRDTKNWRDKQEVSLSGGETPISIKQVIDEVKAKIND